MKKSGNRSRTSSKPKEKQAESPGVLIIVSAPSGCGKTTIVERLLKRHPDWVRSISMTTRPARIGEKDGRDYFFVTPEAFEKAGRRGELLESAKVFDHHYGTPKGFVEEQLKKGVTLILAIDVQGAKNLKRVLGTSCALMSIFILPPSVKVLRERLEGRKTDTQESIDRRIEQAQEEIKEARFYDHTVVNQNLEKTVLEIESLIQNSKNSQEGNNNVVRTT